MGAEIMVQAPANPKMDCDPVFWQRQSSLDGIFRKFGQNLPWVDRVPGNVMIIAVSTSVITGNLIAEDASLCVRFETKDLGDLPILRNRIAMSQPHTMIPMRLSGRAWVQEDGRIVLLVRSFEIQPTAGGVS